MSAMRLFKQAELDALLAQYGIKPLNKTTKDGSHILYVGHDGKHLTLPSQPPAGYAQYMIDDIMGHIRQSLTMSEIVDHKIYHANVRPSLKIINNEE